MKLRVYWVPQIPMEPFYQEVNTIGDAVLLLRTLAAYDQFQVAKNVKPDCCNAGGLSMWDEEDQEWIEYYDDDGYDIEYYLK